MVSFFFHQVSLAFSMDKKKSAIYANVVKAEKKSKRNAIKR